MPYTTKQGIKAKKNASNLSINPLKKHSTVKIKQSFVITKNCLIFTVGCFLLTMARLNMARFMNPKLIRN